MTQFDILIDKFWVSHNSINWSIELRKKWANIYFNTLAGDKVYTKILHNVNP